MLVVLAVIVCGSGLGAWTMWLVHQAEPIVVDAAEDGD